MEPFTVYPENKEESETLEKMFKLMRMHFKKNIKMEDKETIIKRMQERLEEYEDIIDMLEVEKRMDEPNIPAEQVYAEIEKKWK